MHECRFSRVTTFIFFRISCYALLDFSVIGSLCLHIHNHCKRFAYHFRNNRIKNMFQRQPFKGTKRSRYAALDLETKVDEIMGGPTGLALETNTTSDSSNRSSGLYGGRNCSNHLNRKRLFRMPRAGENNEHSTSDRTADNPGRCFSDTPSILSRQSRFSRASSTTTRIAATTTAVHIVCAISENLARETCVTSLDAGSPITVQVTKQGNGQTYAETIAYLEILKPDEVLLNEGRRNSQLVSKVLDLYNVRNTEEVPAVTMRRAPKKTHRRKHESKQGEDEHVEEIDGESRYGALRSSTVVKFVSRSFFDQTKGAELLRKIAREETYDSSVVEEYILLSSAYALLHYTQQCLGATFARNSVYLGINAGGSNRMAIDRTSLLELELLVNSKTGKIKNSLIGTIDYTKTTVGSRLLRTNLMSPPTRVDTVNARLELVDLFLGNEEFFYEVLEHLGKLPDIDKMLSNIALVPRKHIKTDREGDREIVTERMASKGISALVCIKSTLQGLPSFAGKLQAQLLAMENGSGNDGATIATDRSSLLVGLGGGSNVALQRYHLLRAIIFAMTQPALAEILKAVTDIFTESTSFTRNAHAMRHQECFALKCDENGMMSILRKAFLANVDDIYKMADEYAEVYGISVLVRYTASRGYFLAVPADVGSDLPQMFLQPAKNGRFIHCTTQEVNGLNTRAQDNVHDLLLMTHDRIQEVFTVARRNYDSIASLCDAIALLDICHSFADNVTQCSLPWCRPEVTEPFTLRTCHDGATVSGSSASNPGGSLIIRNGRYCIDVSNAGFTDGLQHHIPNDTYAAEEKCFTVITGINGSGKSTYLKQIAIIVILAHCGSYVPAEAACVPIRDRLCCRIGNSDDSEHNISTFLLEMKETAFICNNATNRSLVLVDELGRATSNEDGVAIAWSTSEYLLKKRAMTFFVTHYPQVSSEVCFNTCVNIIFFLTLWNQLTSLASIYPTVLNVHLEASVTKGVAGEIKYTHKVKTGSCEVSTDYGVELASACGWPIEVLQNARDIEAEVEALLPDEGICHQRPLDQVSNKRTQAYEALSMVCKELQKLITADRAQSFATIRDDLNRIQDCHTSRVNPEFLDAMDQLLLRDSDLPATPFTHHPPTLGRNNGNERLDSPLMDKSVDMERLRKITVTAGSEENDDSSSFNSSSDSSEDDSSTSLSSTSTIENQNSGEF